MISRLRLGRITFALSHREALVLLRETARDHGFEITDRSPSAAQAWTHEDAGRLRRHGVERGYRSATVESLKGKKRAALQRAGRRRMVVVEGKYNGKVQRITLAMDDKTRKEGTLDPGSQVKINYREDPGGMLYALALRGGRWPSWQAKEV